MNELNAIVDAARQAFIAAATPADLENAKAQFLGKTGAITELLKSGREVITTSFSPFEILFCVAGLYLLINLPLSKIASRLERRLAQSD